MNGELIPIFDSSILIDCLRGRDAAITLLASYSCKAQLRTHLLVAALDVPPLSNASVGFRSATSTY